LLLETLRLHDAVHHLNLIMSRQRVDDIAAVTLVHLVHDVRACVHDALMIGRQLMVQ